MKIAIYARVFTTDQDCAMQIHELRTRGRTRDEGTDRSDPRENT